jgi:hypothetical protein
MAVIGEAIANTSNGDLSSRLEKDNQTLGNNHISVILPTGDVLTSDPNPLSSRPTLTAANRLPSPSFQIIQSPPAPPNSVDSINTFQSSFTCTLGMMPKDKLLRFCHRTFSLHSELSLQKYMEQVTSLNSPRLIGPLMMCVKRILS